jgi:predicted phosphoribosyltransferase
MAAGVMLATVLKFTIKKKKGASSLCVLGIPRGGVVVANIVAKKLNADYFDIVLPRKLRAPDNKENAIGAIMPDGSIYLDESLVSSLKVTPEYIEREKQLQMKEITRRTMLYRPDATKKGDRYIDNIKDNIVILVDDGIATGGTVIASARWIRKRKPAQLIIATPVAQAQTVDLLKKEADAIEVLSTPSNFGSVEQFYQNFDQITDERVIEILKNRT